MSIPAPSSIPFRQRTARGLRRGKEECSMQHRVLRSLLAAALILAMAPTVVAATVPPETTFLPFGEPELLPQDITDDGSKVVGVAYSGAPYFTWTRTEGIVKIG